jgi:hypothetical protein
MSLVSVSITMLPVVFFNISSSFLVIILIFYRCFPASQEKTSIWGCICRSALAPVVGEWQRWLEACETQQEECGSSTNFMPTKVPGIQNFSPIKLIDTDALKCQYTALSHC